MRLPQIPDSDRRSIEKEYLGTEYLVSYKSSHCGYLRLIISSEVLWDVKWESHNDRSLRPRLGGNTSVVDYACDTRSGYSTGKALFLCVSHSCNCNLSFLIFSWFKVSCDDQGGVDENWDCSQFNDLHYFAGSCHTNLNFHNSQTMVIKKIISPIIPSFIGHQGLSSTHTKNS